MVYERGRGSACKRGYDHEWRRFRIDYLQRFPLCVDCKSQRIVTLARDIHHVAKLALNPDLKYVETNLMGLCQTHHDIRTARGE